MKFPSGMRGVRVIFGFRLLGIAIAALIKRVYSKGRLETVALYSVDTVRNRTFYFFFIPSAKYL